MSNIGNFKKDGETYIGHITLLKSKIGVHLVPVEEKANEQSPDYHLIRPANKSKVGAAWIKKSNSTGNEFLSVAIDGLRSLKLGLFRDEDGAYNLAVLHKRPKRK